MTEQNYGGAGTYGPIDQSQRAAARVVGVTYLFVNITASVNELFVRGPLVVFNDAVATAHNIAANELLFRISVASDLCAFIGDVVLAAAFYVLLKPVGEGIALFGSFSRLTNAAILGMNLINSFLALRILSGYSYLHTFQPGQLQTLARIFLGLHDSGFLIATVFLSLGSLCSSYLLFKGRYVPRPLAGFGVFASALGLVYLFAVIVFPDVSDWAFPWSLVPLLIFEVVAGFWLAVRGLPKGAPSVADSPG